MPIRVQQGLRGVDAGAASQGILRSGATIKAEEPLGSVTSRTRISATTGTDCSSYLGGVDCRRLLAFRTRQREPAPRSPIPITRGACAGAVEHLRQPRERHSARGSTMLANNTAVQSWLGGEHHRDAGPDDRIQQRPVLPADPVRGAACGNNTRPIRITERSSDGPEFTASPDVSGFAPRERPAVRNLPADIQARRQTIQQNRTAETRASKIDLANANMAQVGQAAAGLLSAYPDEASRAAAYPRVVGMLQSQGVAMNAPSTYPGEGALRAIVNASIPAKDLYSSGALLTPAQQAALGQTGQTGTTSTAAPGTTTGAAAPSSAPIPVRGTGGPGASASAPTAWLPYYEEASQKYGVPVDLADCPDPTTRKAASTRTPKAKPARSGCSRIRKPSTATNPGFRYARR